jgi:hypothetical protein
MPERAARIARIAQFMAAAFDTGSRPDAAAARPTV